jgi:hypothetical protein
MLDGPGKNAGDAGKETVRRKRFQHGCVREVKHGSRRVWIGKYYENGQSRTRVLGPVAQMGEGEAWAELQRKYLNPVNEGVGFRQTLPSNFREYVQRAFIYDSISLIESPPRPFARIKAAFNKADAKE